MESIDNKPDYDPKLINDALVIANYGWEEIMRRTNLIITDKELKQFTRPYGIEYPFEYYNIMGWYLLSHPDKISDPNGFNKIDIIEFGISDDEPISPGLDSIAKQRVVNHVSVSKDKRKKFVRKK